MRTTEQLGRYTLTQEDGLPKLGRDSLVLAEFATLRDGVEGLRPGLRRGRSGTAAGGAG